MSETKGMLSELQSDAMASAMEVFLPDITKKLRPFFKPIYKQFSYELGPAEKIFVIRKVLNNIDVITKKDGTILQKTITNFSDDSITYQDENGDTVLKRDEIKKIELSEVNLANELKAKIEELKKFDKFHKDIIPLEKKRNLLGTVCFNVIRTDKIVSFEVQEADVEFAITEPEKLIEGMITGELWQVDKSL